MFTAKFFENIYIVKQELQIIQPKWGLSESLFWWEIIDP